LERRSEGEARRTKTIIGHARQDFEPARSRKKESGRKIDVDFDTNRKRQRIGKQELGDTVTEGVEKREITRRHEGIEDKRQCPTAGSLQPGGIDGVYGAESKGRAGMGISSRREDTERRVGGIEMR
jgi:hypothetical protein